MIEVAQATVSIIPNMQGSQAEITKQLTGSDTASAGTAAGKVVGNSMVTGIGKSMSSAGSALTKGITVPLVAVGTAAVASWSKVDAGLDTIATKTGATGDDLNALKDILNNITSDIPVGFEDAGAAIGEVNTRFGLTGDNLQDLSKAFLKFSKINGTDVSKSVDDVSKVMASFGIETEDAGKVLDALNVVGQQTGVDIGTLTTQLYQNAAQFGEMGMSAEDAASFLGTVDKAGLDTSTMLMGLKTAMKNATEQNLTMDEALTDFEKTMKGNGTESDKLAAAYELFGTRAGAAIYNACANGELDLASFTSSLEGFEGSVDATFETVTSPAENFQTVLNTLMELGYEIAEAVMPVISDVVQQVVPIIQGLVDTWNSLDPGMQQFIIKAALVAACVGPLLSGLGGLFGTVGKLVSPIASLAGGIGNLAGKAGGAIGSLSGCTSSLSSMAGQALLLVALGAAVYVVAQGMSVLVDAAIRLNEAGPGACLVLVELAAVGTGMAAALALIGSVATVSAAGLLALGAAVALVSVGVAAVVASIALLIDSFTTFSAQLPTIAAYGGEAASAIGEISVAMLGLSGSCVTCAASLAAMGVAAAAAFVSFAGAAVTIGATDIAMAAMLVTAGLAAAGLELLGLALDDVDASLSSICESAAEANESLSGIVSFADAVEAALDALFDSVGDFISDFFDAIFKKTPDAKKTGEDLGKAVCEGVENGLKNLESDTKTTVQNANKTAGNEKNNFQNTGKSLGEAIVTGAKTSLSALEATVKTPLDNAMKIVNSAIASLKTTFASTQFAFNSYIALPHFYMNGQFDAKTGSVPSVGVNWYAEAAKQGALFSDPTLIGVGDASQGELLIGEQTLFKMIMDAVRESQGNNVVLNVYGAEGQNVNELARIVMKKMQQAVDRKEAAFA